MNTSEPLIEIVDVEHTYGGAKKALAGVNVTIGRGEFVAIIGKNGSGKTTLAKHFNGLLRPANTNGMARLRTKDGRTIDTRGARLHQLASIVGYVFQNPDRPIFHDTCHEELEFGPRNLGTDPEVLRHRVSQTLELVGLAGCEEANPVNLSRGERQRLAIASTVVMGCDVVVIDEPTTGQDRVESRRILGSLAHHHARGSTVVIISHDTALVAEYATRVIAMRHGQVLTEGTPTEVFSQQAVLEETNTRPPQAAVLGAKLGLSEVLTVEDAVREMRASMLQARSRGAHSGEVG